MGIGPLATDTEKAHPRHAEAERTPHELWEHCRNSLGIARLLVQEERAKVLVETACRMTVEAACRAGLAQSGLAFDGDVVRALWLLAAPRDLLASGPDEPAAARLAAAESVVGWVAEYRRSEAPEHPWGY